MDYYAGVVGDLEHLEPHLRLLLFVGGEPCYFCKGVYQFPVFHNSANRFHIIVDKKDQVGVVCAYLEAVKLASCFYLLDIVEIRVLVEVPGGKIVVQIVPVLAVPDIRFEEQNPPPDVFNVIDIEFDLVEVLLDVAVEARLSHNPDNLNEFLVLKPR